MLTNCVQPRVYYHVTLGLLLRAATLVTILSLGGWWLYYYTPNLYSEDLPRLTRESANGITRALTLSTSYPR